jgi:hypothetical protein
LEKAAAAIAAATFLAFTAVAGYPLAFPQLKAREFLLPLALQFGVGALLAHGYDFRVSYVAGRNVASGLSPYEGGLVEGFLASGYGGYVQGIGETPLWPLYLGMAYLLSGGQIFLFNLFLKTPIVLANLVLAFLMFRLGRDGRYFLYNPFLLLVSVAWGKPDNIAALLAVTALTAYGPIRSPLSAAASLMVKPLTITAAPAYLARHRQSFTRIAAATALTAAMFFSPFIALGWSLETPLNGLSNWIKPAGGISPFNLVEAVYGFGSYTLPDGLELIGMLSPASILLLVIFALYYPPKSLEGVFRLGLLSSSLFLSLRPWVSEQNLLIIHVFLILVCGRLPNTSLWTIPLAFAAANLAIPQTLYLVRPTIIDELYLLDNPIRLWLKFILAATWLAALWTVIIKRRLWFWRV